MRNIIVESNRSNIDVWVGDRHFNIDMNTIHEDISLSEEPYDIDVMVDEFISDTFETEMELTEEEKEKLRFHFFVIYAARA